MAVWEYPILTLSMAALVKFAALQNMGRFTCEEMLRQQKAALSRKADLGAPICCRLWLVSALRAADAALRWWDQGPVWAA